MQNQKGAGKPPPDPLLFFAANAVRAQFLQLLFRHHVRIGCGLSHNLLSTICDTGI